jgi:hypothetical protein
MTNENGTARLERIERALELLIADHVQFREEHKQLLTAQVVLTDNMAKLAVAQKRAEEKIAELAEAQASLIHIVDDLIRRNRIE